LSPIEKKKKRILLFFIINSPNVTANNQVEQFSGLKVVSFLFLSKHYNSTIGESSAPMGRNKENKEDNLWHERRYLLSPILTDQPLNSLE
jgi:hypothetical protein